LYELLLSDTQQKELDDLWKDLDFVASASIRTYVQFYIFETSRTRRFERRLPWSLQTTK
jgi:hypothetical protein